MSLQRCVFIYIFFFFNFTPGRCIRKNKIKVAEQKLRTFLAYLQELPFKNPVLVVWLVAKLVWFQRFCLTPARKMQVKYFILKIGHLLVYEQDESTETISSARLAQFIVLE